MYYFVLRGKLMINKLFSKLGVFFLGLLSYVPFSILFFISSLLYYPLYYLIRYRRKVVRKNLTLSFPEKSINEIIKIEKEYYRFFTDMIFENIKFHSISKKEVLKRVKINGIEQFKKHYNDGKKVMLCGAHYGNWEFLSLAFTLDNPAVTMVIYKPLNNKVFDEWYHYWRTRFGTIMVPMRNTLRAIASHQNEPYTLCFAADQSPSKQESLYFIDFLNQKTAVMLGVEKISRKTDSPIYYFKTTRLGRGKYQVDLIPVCLNPAETVDMEITKLHFTILEEIIKETPAYWLWSHNRWKNQPTQ